MRILVADHILPISSEPLENGAIAIQRDKIIAVGKGSEITSRFPQAEVKDFGRAVLMPGLINCHAHLELTALRNFLDDLDGDFPGWLIKLTKTRADVLTTDDITTSAICGALEGVRAGITCFADIGRQGRAGIKALKTNGLRGVVFQETEFSPDDKTAAEDFRRLRDKYLELKDSENVLVRPGISPHSPYTVSKRLFEHITEFSLAEEVPLTIHAAESAAEAVFLKTGGGLFAEIFEKSGIDWRPPGLSPIKYLHQTGVLAARPLLAHCVRVSDRDIQIVAESGATIAHCPKSNAKLGHGSAPFEKFLDFGIPVGFGSDSVASNNTCDILEESRFALLLARAREDRSRLLGAAEIIRSATIGAAGAIGLDDIIGSLEAGKQADIIAISLENPAQQPAHDIYAALVFASSSRDVRMTMVAGEEVYRDGFSNRVDEIELNSKMLEIAAKMRR